MMGKEQPSHGADMDALNGANAMIRSKNINTNTDFTSAGIHSANTKHVPYAVRKGNM